MSWLLAVLVTTMIQAADDPRTLEVAANAHFQRGNWSDAEAAYLELLSVVDSQAKPTADAERLRLRCWNQLEQLARQSGRPDEALRFAQKTRDATVRFADDDSRTLNALHIAEYQLALGDDSAARSALDDLLVGRSGVLKTLPKLRTQFLLGVVDHRANDAATARANWAKAEQSIATLFNQHRKAPFLPAADWLDLQQRLIAICEAQQRDDDAKPLLEELIQSRTESSLFAALLGLARHARLRQDNVAAERHVQAALDQTNRVSPRQRASALRLLATVLEDRDPTRSRDAWLRMAQTLEPADAEAANQNAAASDLRWLIEGYSRADQLADAIRHAERWLAQEQSAHGAKHRLTITAVTTLGELKARIGDLNAAEQLLRRALTANQAADQPREQLRTLLQLATVRRSVGDLADAERLLRSAIELSDKRLSLDETDHSQAKLQLAALLPSAGRFRESILLNQQILDAAQQRGPSADRLRAEVLLNLAVIDRNQGLTESAAEKAKQAASVAAAAFGREAWQLAATHNVLSAISRDLGQIEESATHAQSALRLCQQHGKDQHSEAAVAHQQLGSLAAKRGDLANAATHWQSAVTIFRSRGQSAREAQVLGLLGGLALQTNDHELAAAALDAAEQLLRGRATSPLDRYVIFANQALRRFRDGDRTEAIRLLQQAIDIAESARTETAGDAEAGRARFFAQFAPAFERLIDWHLQAGHTNEAFLAAEQSRSRTFLDQLQVAGIDLKSTLPPDVQQRLLTQEHSLAQRQRQLRRELSLSQSRPANDHDSNSDTIAELQRDLAESERNYANVWQAIRDASPVYSQLLVNREALCDLPRVQRELLPADTVMLFYQLGNQSSSVWIIGGPQDAVEVVPLRISQTLPALQFRESINPPTRGIVGRLSVDKGLLRRGLETIPPGPVTREVASRLVTWYLAATVPFSPSGSRGLAGTVATVKGEAIKPSVLTLVADTLLPPPVRDAIARRQPKSIVIIPDAALHQLPFESLLLVAGPQAKYVLDEWPPITYAPSATVLSRLAQRAGQTKLAEQGLLLVGHSGQETADPAPLPGVTQECRRITELWPKPVTKLFDKAATESMVTKHLPTHRVLHLATHGFVDEQADNLFGGLLLAAEPGDTDHGYLSYLDILRANLTRCELAVLSACQTSVGPERPMEASTSLAQAFLAAGAHQVVASLWHVSDDSTAELMSDFYRRLAEDVAANRPLRVAESLHAAKRHLRQHAEFNSPAHWASFVFIGPVK